MVFSTSIFVFAFLPIALIGHCLLPRWGKNAWLLLVSLLFYTWGEQERVLLMMASIGGNYIGGRMIATAADDARRKTILAITITFNLGLLVAFKYAAFMAINLSTALDFLQLPTLPIPQVALPIGISFFTFQAMSYVIDVYQRKTAVQRSIIDFATYVALFPQLIAGPIVRYREISWQLLHRRFRIGPAASGIRRFVIGLSKKLLIANPAAVIADRVFALPSEQLDTGIAWIGVVAFTIQIYFDFSGYSDMAIGLGRLLGFRLPENFAYPYSSRSITEFWRRWHMSLSRWFRDYVYIPLGGNRAGKWRTSRNLWVVFLLCGFWHGSTWSFVIWGAYHGLLLVMERVFLLRVLNIVPQSIRLTWTMLLVMIGWVFFRASDLSAACNMLIAMTGSGMPAGTPAWQAIVPNESWLVLSLGIVLAMPVWPAITRRLRSRGSITWELASHIGYAALGWLCATQLAAATHNPFLYYRF